MDFLWPLGLWLAPALVALPFAYVWLLRRQKRALVFSNLGLIREAVAGKATFRRHLPPLLFFAALVLMAFALTRPTAIVTLPSDRATIILAIDVSGSMRAQDVEPTRMAAAQAAARAFVTEQPPGVRIGLVAFSGNAMVAQMPTLMRQDVLDALDRLHPQRYTAVGSGIIASLQAIFPEMELGQYLTSGNAQSREPQSRELGKPPEAKTAAPAPVPPGSYTSAVIVLLSDGRTNAGFPPVDAAHIAADRGVRVFTIGFGSPQGSTADYGVGFMRLQPDEETLKQISEITKAGHFNAQTAGELKEIYKGLTTQFVAETKRTELTAFIAMPALILLVIAIGLSVLWSNRMT